jgi:small redox-active disulfide protein 2
MEVKVLGSGCANCRRTAALIAEVAGAKGLAIDLGKVEDVKAIVGYGVMATPGVVIDGKVVHAGGVPSREKVEQWFAAPAAGQAELRQPS